MDYESLIKAAQAAKKKSHSPFSRFRVGAALLTKSGAVYSGCNVEISTYALTLCAERTALFKAVSEGQKKFVALAISTDESGFISPCGACRQVIMDLAGNIDIILTNKRGKFAVYKTLDLFPFPFGPQNLKRK